MVNSSYCKLSCKATFLVAIGQINPWKKAFIAIDAVFAISFKISRGFVEGVKKWHLSENILEQDIFSRSFRLKFTFSDRIRNIKLIWKFEVLPLLRKGRSEDLGGHAQFSGWNQISLLILSISIRID